MIREVSHVCIRTALASSFNEGLQHMVPQRLYLTFPCYPFLPEGQFISTIKGAIYPRDTAFNKRSQRDII